MENFVDDNEAYFKLKPGCPRLGQPTLDHH